MAALAPHVEQEVVRGEADILQTFPVKDKRGQDSTLIAGCRVNSGSIATQELFRVLRSGDVVWEGRCGSLKRHKLDVQQVGKVSRLLCVPSRATAVQLISCVVAYRERNAVLCWKGTAASSLVMSCAASPRSCGLKLSRMLSPQRILARGSPLLGDAYQSISPECSHLMSGSWNHAFHVRFECILLVCCFFYFSIGLVERLATC